MCFLSSRSPLQLSSAPPPPLYSPAMSTRLLGVYLQCVERGIWARIQLESRGGVEKVKFSCIETAVFPKKRNTRLPMPEIIDPVFAKTSPKRSFCMTENERFGLIFVKTGSINSGTIIQ